MAKKLHGRPKVADKNCRVIRLDPEAVKIIEEERARFLSLFGREPGPTDPVFLDVNVKMSTDQLHNELGDLLDADGVDPAEAYAFRKTGILVTKENRKNLTKKDMNEWQKAKSEYNRLGESAYDVDEHPADGEFLTNLVTEYDNCLTVLAYVLTHNDLQELPNEHDVLFVFVYFCLTKSLKSLRSIRVLVERGLGEDSLIIARSIYENYLHIVFLLQNPKKIEDLVIARIGLNAGTHEYKTSKSGKPVYDQIIDKSTGKVLEGKISTRSMAASSPFPEDRDIHENLYQFLSGFTHPDVITLQHYMDADTLDHRSSSMIVEAYTWGLVFGSLLLDCIADPPLLTDQRVKDVRYFLSRVKPFIHRTFAEQLERGGANRLFLALSNRISRINEASGNLSRNQLSILF